MSWLEGKVALVTGAASGIGKAVVRRYRAEGAQVCAFDLSAERLTELAAEFPQVVTVQGDVTRFDDNVRAVAATVAAFGKLDVFVGNAGVFDGLLWLRDLPADRIGPAFDEILGVNVKGYLYGAKAAMPHLQASGGCMIFTTSNAGFYPDGGGPIYTASKHAQVGLIRQLAFELAPTVRVNGVAPGGTATNLGASPSLRGVPNPRLSPISREARIKGRNPLRMVGQPEDHVGAYVLLASDQSRAMTGTVIESDGGIGVRGLTLPPPDALM